MEKHQFSYCVSLESVYLINSVANLNSPPATGDSETSFSHPPMPPLSGLSPADPASFPRTSAVMRSSSGAGGGPGYSRMSAVLPPPPHPPPPQPRPPRERWPLNTEPQSSAVQVKEKMKNQEQFWGSTFIFPWSAYWEKNLCWSGHIRPDQAQPWHQPSKCQRQINFLQSHLDKFFLLAFIYFNAITW